VHLLLPLFFVGLGFDEGYITNRAMDAINNSDLLFIDTYTMPNATNMIEKIRRLIGGNKKVVEANRELLEKESKVIIEEAKNKTISILVPGDPFIATTHESLVIEAAANGIQYEIINGLSGICAAKSISGLQYYKFGKTITIPGGWRKIKAFSVLHGFYGNLCLGLHTLFLFDINDKGESLSIKDGMRYILELNEEAGLYKNLGGLLGVIIHVGKRNVIYGDSISSISQKDIEIEQPYSLAIPSRIHAIEEEYLRYNAGIEDRAIKQHKALLNNDFCKYLGLLREYL